MPDPEPQFPRGIDTEIAEAVLAKLRGDATLAAFFTGGIDGFDTEDLYTEGTFDPPFLGVSIEFVDEQREGSNRQARMSTGILIGVVLSQTGPRETRTWLFSRLVEYVKRLLEAEAGVLYDEGPSPITESLLAVQRIQKPTRLPGPTTGLLLMRRAVFIFQSLINQETGAVI